MYNVWFYWSANNIEKKCLIYTEELVQSKQQMVWK